MGTYEPKIKIKNYFLRNHTQRMKTFRLLHLNPVKINLTYFELKVLELAFFQTRKERNMMNFTFLYLLLFINYVFSEAMNIVRKWMCLAKNRVGIIHQITLLLLKRVFFPNIRFEI